MPEERTFGFSKADALEIVQLIGNADTEFTEMRVRPSALKLVRFELLESLSTGTANATINSMDGDEIDEDDVLDPEEIFASLTTGDTGLALKQGGKYYVIQAPCGGT